MLLEVHPARQRVLGLGETPKPNQLSPPVLAVSSSTREASPVSNLATLGKTHHSEQVEDHQKDDEVG